MSEVARLWATFGADTSGFKRGAGFVKSELGGMSKSMNSLLPVIGGIGAALGGVFAAKELVEGAKRFNKQLTNIESLGGRTTEQMNELRNAMLGAGSNTFLQGGADAMVGAFYDIASGVQGTDKQMAIFNASIATAEAGQAELSTTTAGLVSFMNAYNLSADKATDVSNMFSKTVGLGVGSMTEFVGAMAPTAGMASQMNVSFNELGASMAFLTTKGVGASESATQIESAMSALLTPNEAMIPLFKKLGWSSGRLAIKQLGLVGAFKKLKEAAGGSEEILAQALGRKEAVKGVMALTGSDFDGFFRTFNSGLATATEEMQKIQANSPEAIIERFGNQADALGKKIGTVLLPPLGKLAEFFSGILDNFNPAAIDAFISSIGTAISSFDPKSFIGGIQNALGKAGDWLGSDGPGKLATGLTDMMKGAADWVINTGWPTFRDGISTLTTNIMNFIQGEGAMKFISGLGAMITNAKDWILNTGVPKLFEGIAYIGTKIYTFFAGDGWQNFKSGLSRAFENAKAWIVNEGIPKFIAAIRSLIAAAGNELSALGDRIRISVENGIRQAAGLPPIPIPEYYPKMSKFNNTTTSGMGSMYAQQRGNVPFRDSGGKVQPHKLFASGVPELFVPQTAGNAYPMGNWQPLMGGGSGGGSGRNVNINMTVIDRDLESRIESILERELT
jgi:TP901 family phage tail tape measure protein